MKNSMGLNASQKRLQDAASPRRAQVRRLRAEGWTWSKIAEFYGISRQRAQQIGVE